MRRTDETGEPDVEGEGANSGVARICWRRSGEALRRNQLDWPDETATCACVRGRPFNVPPRRALQFGQAQFHWGKPPPAAEPRTLIFMSRRHGTRWHERIRECRACARHDLSENTISVQAGHAPPDTIPKLEFGVCVRANFTIEVDLFVLRGNPFHGGGSLNVRTAKITHRVPQEQRRVNRGLSNRAERKGEPNHQRLK